MRRFAASVVAVAGGAMLFVPNALALHNYGHPTPGGFPWETVVLWGAIGIGVVLLAAWFGLEARRHHWLPPHRPIHTS